MPLVIKSVLECDLIKTDGIVKNKKRHYSSYIESPIFNTNPNNSKLQILQEGKQLEEKTKLYNTNGALNKQSES